MLRVALAKGRLLKSFIEYLQQVNQIEYCNCTFK